jgi:nucleotide-binding universal stress UspA family protein
MTGETILVPLDGSAQSEAVLPYTMAIAKAEGSTLRLLSVVEPEGTNPLLAGMEHDSDLAVRMHSEAGQYLSQMVAALKQQGVQASSLVVAGAPTEEIRRAAESGDIAMLAMATHGRGGLQRWALGSVADKVMRMSTTPTLLVRPSETPQEDRTVALRRLLVPLDGSPLAEEAIAPAARLAQSAGAKLVLLRVEPWLSSRAVFATEGMYIPNLSTLEDEVGAAAKEYIDSARQQVPSGVSCESVVLRGFVNVLLEAYVEEGKIDLVVMSTHGRGGLARFVVGSKADSLVRAGAPTLLIRPQGLMEKETPAREPSGAVS